MFDRLTRTATFALYQSSLALAITMMPLALLTKKFGVTLPLHRLVKRSERAYQASR